MRLPKVVSPTRPHFQSKPAGERGSGAGARRERVQSGAHSEAVGSAAENPDEEARRSPRAPGAVARGARDPGRVFGQEEAGEGDTAATGEGRLQSGPDAPDEALRREHKICVSTNEPVSAGALQAGALPEAAALDARRVLATGAQQAGRLRVPRLLLRGRGAADLDADREVLPAQAQAAGEKREGKADSQDDLETLLPPGQDQPGLHAGRAAVPGARDSDANGAADPVEAAVAVREVGLRDPDEGGRGLREAVPEADEKRRQVQVAVDEVRNGVGHFRDESNFPLKFKNNTSNSISKFKLN